MGDIKKIYVKTRSSRSTWGEKTRNQRVSERKRAWVAALPWRREISRRGHASWVFEVGGAGNMHEMMACAGIVRDLSRLAGGRCG